MDLQYLIEHLKNEGVAQVGFSCVEDAVDERYAKYKYAVTLVYKLSDAIFDEVKEMGSPTFAYFQHYRTVNAFLDRSALWVSTMIEREGFRALPVAASQSVKDMGEYSGIFQHKTAAVKAGLGWIGKSALFVSPIYGPRVRLATVLTDMPLPELEHDELAGKKFGCAGCSVCVKKCPAMAIKGNEYIEGVSKRSDIFDARACSEHMKAAYKNIGRGAVCGICVASCPYGIRK